MNRVILLHHNQYQEKYKRLLESKKKYKKQNKEIYQNNIRNKKIKNNENLSSRKSHEKMKINLNKKIIQTDNLRHNQNNEYFKNKNFTLLKNTNNSNNNE